MLLCPNCKGPYTFKEEECRKCKTHITSYYEANSSLYPGGHLGATEEDGNRASWPAFPIINRGKN